MITPEEMQAVANQRALEAIGYVFKFGLHGWSVTFGNEVIKQVIKNPGRRRYVEQSTCMKYRILAVPFAIADKQKRGL